MIDLQSQKLRNEICDISRRLYARGFISGAEGNISARLADGTMLCTPTSISKGFMTIKQMARVDASGKLIEGPLAPTSECPMHLAIYKAQPAAQAIVHAHPPYATALGVADIPLPAEMLFETINYLGEVPLLPFQIPGTAELGRQVASVCGGARVVMMKNHGALAWAETLEEAWLLMEALESCCRVAYLAQTLGKIDLVPPEIVPQLPKARPIPRK